MNRTILSLCDGTGAWSKPYVDAGYDVIKIDLASGQDVRLMNWIDKPIRGILAAPPCTKFSKAGARLWKEWGEEGLIDGLSIVDACLRAIAIYRPKWWALENPVGRLQNWLGPARHRFHPWEYGDPWTKQTLLWGNFSIPKPTPCKEPTLSGSPGSRDLTTKLSGQGKGKIRRSETPPGFAKAFFLANL